MSRRRLPDHRPRHGLVEVELDTGETVIAEAGAMSHPREDTEFEARMGDGADADEGSMGELFSTGER